MNINFLDPRLPDHFWSKVQPCPTSGCWLWIGATGTKDGYGSFGLGGSRNNHHAHRVAYRALVGDVPNGLELDHLCRVRSCCNPAHLEPVTSRENTMRGQTPAAKNAAKTECPSGHPYDQVNTLYVAGRRQCRACNRARTAARAARSRARLRGQS